MVSPSRAGVPSYCRTGYTAAIGHSSKLLVRSLPNLVDLVAKLLARLLDTRPLLARQVAPFLLDVGWQYAPLLLGLHPCEHSGPVVELAPQLTPLVQEHLHLVTAEGTAPALVDSRG